VRRDVALAELGDEVGRVVCLVRTDGDATKPRQVLVEQLQRRASLRVALRGGELRQDARLGLLR